MVVLFLLTVLLQTALITWQHFSPFERESNLRAVLWGARPAPRYWAVVALDVCTVLLVALLVLGVWPQAPDDLPLDRLARMLPAWVLAALLAAVRITISTIPSSGFLSTADCTATVLALVLGAVVVMATLLAIAVAVAPDLGSAMGEWARILPAVLLPALCLALLVFILRALAFFLRVIPVLGSFAHAAVSTGCWSG